MSLYAEYLKERSDDLIVEDDFGFVTYRYLNVKEVKKVYIIDIYVRPEYRQTRHATALADTVVAEAKQRGCTECLGTVVPSAKGSTTSLRVLLGYGFELESSANDLIVFTKDI